MFKTASIRWDAQGVPHSLEFRDKYFCTQNGYEETRYIATAGNDLERRFKSLDPDQPGDFVIAETGFGTGLGFCCICELWDQFAPRTWSLHYFSVELYPLNTDDINRALNLWPALAKYRQALVDVYQPDPGMVRTFNLKEWKIHLTIAFDDVVKGLQWIHEKQLAPGKADAWFLHGFSPFANPLMWSKDVFAAMRTLSKVGTTLSTFTVAGDVRRGLQEEGFTVERIKGYGTKSQILKGHFVG